MSQVDHRLASFADDILWMEGRPVTGGTDRSLQAALMRGSKFAQALERQDARTASEVARTVREHVKHLVRRTTQVVVKVTGGGADMRRIAAHLQYIQRSGRYRSRGQEELVLENENGDLFLGKQGREAAQREFGQGGHPIPDEITGLEEASTRPRTRRRREALNVIFSMPGGVAREEVMHAARAAAHEIFAGHQWLIAHHDDTDNPHSHVLVKMVGHDGSRLNPRKADLERWRITFARQLQARGIEAVATRRRVRMQRRRGESQAVRELRSRGATPRRDVTAQSQPEAVRRALANEARMRQVYGGVALALAASESPEDQRLARDLNRYLQQHGRTQHPVPTPRPGL